MQKKNKSQREKMHTVLYSMSKKESEYLSAANMLS